MSGSKLLAFRLTFSKNLSGALEQYQSVKLFGSRSGPIDVLRYVGPDLGPNCKQRLSAGEKMSLLTRKELHAKREAACLLESLGNKSPDQPALHTEIAHCPSKFILRICKDNGVTV